jgi:hypothetical protein
MLFEQDTGAGVFESVVFALGRIDTTLYSKPRATALENLNAQALSRFCAHKKRALLFRGAIGNGNASNHRMCSC